jgi:4'-phosphopantetheinyl transferase
MKSILLLYSKIQEKQQTPLLQNCLGLFSVEIQKKILQYRRWQDIQLTLLGKLLLLEGMSRLNELSFGPLYFTECNKPYFQDSNIQFNISHSGNIVVCVLTKRHRTIGVDIERIHPIKIEDYKSHLTEYEDEVISSSKIPKEAFFRYWTQKEAVLKAHGYGLIIPLKSFEIRNNSAQIDDKSFYVLEILLNNHYSCHVASELKLYPNDIEVDYVDISRFINYKKEPLLDRKL